MIGSCKRHSVRRRLSLLVFGRRSAFILRDQHAPSAPIAEVGVDILLQPVIQHYQGGGGLALTGMKASVSFPRSFGVIGQTFEKSGPTV